MSENRLGCGGSIDLNAVQFQLGGGCDQISVESCVDGWEGFQPLGIVFIVLIKLDICHKYCGENFLHIVQSGQSSRAKHGGAYFSAVSGSIKDLIAAPGSYENKEA